VELPRVYLYGIIHKTLRVELFDTCNKIASANFTDPGEREEVVRAIQCTMSFVDEHGVHEDTFVEPAVRSVNADLANRVRADHEALDPGTKLLLGLVSELSGTEGMMAVAIGARLHGQYCSFLGEYLTHMSVEENQVNEALWSAYTDEELAGLRTELQGSLPPQRFAELVALMVPAMNLQERIGVLGGMEMGAPPAVFEALSAIAQNALGEAGWAEVAKELPS